MYVFVGEASWPAHFHTVKIGGKKCLDSIELELMEADYNEAFSLSMGSYILSTVDQGPHW